MRKAKLLFPGHKQPKVPLNNNYYNLLDDNQHTAEWQSRIALENGVYGFCYYHYWFKDGKKLLEKPAERMLENKNIKIPFCFCWANENWTRRWDGGNNEIIAEQDYGNEIDWERHFQYLLPFFKDDRYILMNNEPVLLIYKANEIPCVNDMVRYFKKRCRDEGFSGCSIIYQFPWFLGEKKFYKKQHDLSKYVYDYLIAFEPQYSILSRTPDMRTLSGTLCRIANKAKSVYREIRHKAEVVDYDMEWEQILNRPLTDKHMFAGAFTDWDNTPRRTCGLAYKGASPEKFERYLGQLAEKVQESELHNVIFLTAWNEWGEGSYLEPDEDNGYGYLEAVRRVVERSSMPQKGQKELCYYSSEDSKAVNSGSVEPEAIKSESVNRSEATYHLGAVNSEVIDPEATVNSGTAVHAGELHKN